jgi:hypothetical protein
VTASRLSFPQNETLKVVYSLVSIHHAWTKWRRRTGKSEFFLCCSSSSIKGDKTSCGEAGGGVQLHPAGFAAPKLGPTDIQITRRDKPSKSLLLRSLFCAQRILAVPSQCLQSRPTFRSTTSCCIFDILPAEITSHNLTPLLRSLCADQQWLTMAVCIHPASS